MSEKLSDKNAKEAAARDRLKQQIKLFYQEFHKPGQEKPFAPGDRIPYAGRIYDEREMSNLLEATLDFWLTSGRFSKQFEKNFAKLLGVRSCSLTNSGSSANLLALSALTASELGDRRIAKGDEVITVACGFPTTVAPIIQNAAVPVFIDVTLEDGTYNADVSKLESALSDRSKAVIFAHTLGNPFDLDTVKAFCDKHQLWLIEDNCDALGSKYNGKFTGAFGDIATSSFYPPHHMTMGEGGAVYTDSPKLTRLIESFRDWGRDCWCPSGKDNTCGKRFTQQLGTLPEGYDHKYTYSQFAYNLRPTDMQAAVGCAQLDRLEEFGEARRRNWSFFRDALDDLQDVFILPEATPGADPSWFGFLLTLREEAGINRTEIIKALEAANIQTRMLFAGNMLRQPCFDEMRKSGEGFRVVGELKNTDTIMKNTFWFGVYPGLSSSMLE